MLRLPRMLHVTSGMSSTTHMCIQSVLKPSRMQRVMFYFIGILLGVNH